MVYLPSRSLVNRGAIIKIKTNQLLVIASLLSDYYNNYNFFIDTWSKKKDKEKSEIVDYFLEKMRAFNE